MPEVESSLCASVSSTKVKPEASWRICDSGWKSSRDKKRLIEFGRYAAERRARRGLGKPETFNFPWIFSYLWAIQSGVFQLKRQTRRDRMRARLRVIKEKLQRRMHEPSSWPFTDAILHHECDNITTPSRCTGPVSTTASTRRHVQKLLRRLPQKNESFRSSQIRCRISRLTDHPDVAPWWPKESIQDAISSYKRRYRSISDWELPRAKRGWQYAPQLGVAGCAELLTQRLQ